MPQQPNQPKKPIRRKPMGPGITWTDSDLEKLAEITPEDLQAANQLWEKAAPPAYKKLLQAEIQEDGPTKS